jgi:hypothetical protein
LQPVVAIAADREQIEVLAIHIPEEDAELVIQWPGHMGSLYFQIKIGQFHITSSPGDRVLRLYSDVVSSLLIKAGDLVIGLGVPPAIIPSKVGRPGRAGAFEGLMRIKFRRPKALSPSPGGPGGTPPPRSGGGWVGVPSAPPLSARVRGALSKGTALPCPS